MLTDRSTGILPVGPSGVSPDVVCGDNARCPGETPMRPTGETPVLPRMTTLNTYRRSAASLPGQSANGARMAFRYGSSKSSYRAGGEAFGLADERFSRLNKSLSVERMRVDSFVSTFR